MTIEIDLTIKEARKLLKAIEGPSVIDPAVADIYEFLQRQLRLHDATAAKAAPWRKVVSFDSRASLNGMETLECGHRRNLKYSKNWVEPRADRRRCNQCAAEVQRSL